MGGQQKKNFGGDLWPGEGFFSQSGHKEKRNAKGGNVSPLQNHVYWKSPRKKGYQGKKVESGGGVVLGVGCTTQRLILWGVTDGKSFSKRKNGK